MATNHTTPLYFLILILDLSKSICTISGIQDLLWRDILVYRGRIDLDQCDIEDIKDGKGQTSPDFKETLMLSYTMPTELLHLEVFAFRRNLQHSNKERHKAVRQTPPKVRHCLLQNDAAEERVDAGAAARTTAGGAPQAFDAWC